MQRVKGRRVDLASQKQVPQVGSRAGAAGIARTRGIGRPIVFGVTGILDVDAPETGEQLTVARIPRRQHTVEEVDPTSHRLDQIGRRSDAHQITRSTIRE